MKTDNHCTKTAILVDGGFYRRRAQAVFGDSDFVSAAKLARREGIDFILDPLGAPIKPDLFEHIDGLRTCDKAFTVHTKK